VPSTAVRSKSKARFRARGGSRLVVRQVREGLRGGSRMLAGMSKKGDLKADEASSENELDAAAQQAADQELLQACRSGTVVEAKAALLKGANFTAVDGVGRTGLMLACRRRRHAVAVPIVQLLLGKKCPMSQRDSTAAGWNALHYACLNSSAEVVQLLLEADSRAAMSLAGDRTTPLAVCTENDNVEEALKIATLLLNAGCPVDATFDVGVTTLMSAAAFSGPQIVSLLIARGADVHARDDRLATPLHHACGNGVYGREIVPLLCAAGADATAQSKDGCTSFGVALVVSKAMADAMVPFLPAGFRQRHLPRSSADPLGSLTCAVEHGAVVRGGDFAGDVLSGGWSCAQCWADLRNGLPILLDDSDKDAFRVLLRSKDAKLWKWASSEPQMQQHPITGDTVFHLLCRTEALTIEQKLSILADLRRDYRNSLTPNYRNELCVTLAREPELKKALQEYACWQPHRLAMEWFGPLFQQRAFALLLVCHRLKREHPKALEGLNRDIRHLLVKYASRVEYIYITSVAR
jgi:ankyrin repeat protein